MLIFLVEILKLLCKCGLRHFLEFSLNESNGIVIQLIAFDNRREYTKISLN